MLPPERGKMMPVKVPLVNRGLGCFSAPLRGKYFVTFLNQDGTSFECTYIGDNLRQVVEHVFESSVLFPYPVSVSLDGVYFHDCYYPLEHLEDCPVDVDVILSVLR